MSQPLKFKFIRQTLKKRHVRWTDAVNTVDHCESERFRSWPWLRRHRTEAKSIVISAIGSFSQTINVLCIHLNLLLNLLLINYYTYTQQLHYTYISNNAAVISATYTDSSIHAVVSKTIPYSRVEHRPPGWSLSLNSEPTSNISHKPRSRLSMLSVRLEVTIPAVWHHCL